MNRIFRRNDHEGRGNGDARKQIEKEAYNHHDMSLYRPLLAVRVVV